MQPCFIVLQNCRARQNNDKVVFSIYITNINYICYYQTGYSVDTKILGLQGYAWWVLIVKQNHYDFHKTSFLYYLEELLFNVLLLGLSPPVKYLTDRSKALLILCIFYVFVLSCVCYVFVRVCLYVLCGHLLGRADLLALVCGVCCEFVTFPLVSWVRCGT